MFNTAHKEFSCSWNIQCVALSALHSMTAIFSHILIPPYTDMVMKSISRKLFICCIKKNSNLDLHHRYGFAQYFCLFLHLTNQFCLLDIPSFVPENYTIFISYTAQIIRYISWFLLYLQFPKLSTVISQQKNEVIIPSFANSTRIQTPVSCLNHRYRYSRCQVAQANKFCMVGPKTCGSLVTQLTSPLKGP